MADDTSQKRTDDLGHISPLLGTQTAQRAIDGLTLKIQKLGDGLDKATQFLDRISQKSGAGFGNTGTQSGGKPNGGGSTPRRPYDDIVLGGGGGNAGGAGTPTTQSGNKGNGGWGSKVAGATAGIALAGRASMSTYVTTDTTAQIMARQSGASWQSIRSGFSRNNVTAVNSIDAAQGGANLQRMGYVPQSGQWSAAQGYAKNVGYFDPTATYTGTTNAMADLASGRSWNLLASRGINSASGNPLAISSQMLSQWGIGQGRRVTRAEIAQTMSQNSQFSIGLNQQVAAGNLTQDAATALRQGIQAELTAQQHGVSRNAFRSAVASGNQDVLDKAGFKETDLTRLKKNEAKMRNVEDNMAGGFSKGIDHATDLLKGFNDILEKITGHAGIGSALGYGGGVLGTVTSGAGFAVGGIFAKSMLTKAGRSFVRRAPSGSKAAEAGEAAGWFGRSVGALGDAAGAVGKWGPKVGEWAGKAGGLLGEFGGPMLGVGTQRDTLPAPKVYDPKTHAWKTNPQYDASTGGWKGDTQKGAKTGSHFWSPLFGGDDALQNWVDKNAKRSTNNDGHPGGASMASGGGSSLSGSQHDNGSKAKKKTDSRGGATAADAIAIAKRYLGVRYDWGGSSPKGFDCSGLMVYVFKQLGINLPRTAAEQARVGTPIAMRDVRPGDLLFINQGGRVTHVAMSVGGGKIIEAPQPGGHVRIVNQYASLNMARRVLGAVGNVGGLGAPSDSVSGDQRALGGMPALGGDLGNLSGVSGSEADIVSAALSTTLGVSFDQAEGQKGNEAAGAAGASGKPSGAMPKGNVSSWIKQALGYLHLPYNKYGSALNTIIQHESGGNPRAVNNWDSNAAAGHPSKGIMQTIDSTFSQYAANGHKDIWNPVDNIIAATKYALARYGSMDNVPGIRSLNNGGGYKGYDVGSTNIDVDQIAKVHKGEMVIPAAQAEAIRQQLATNTPLAGGRGGSGQVLLKFEKGSIALHASGPMNDSQATDFAKTIVRMISESAELKKIAEGVG